MKEGKVAMKMRYLGDAYIGQDLCWCRISIAENAVAVYTYRDGVQVSSRFIDDPNEVLVIKAKLRSYIMRRAAPKKWRVVKMRYGAELQIYYPSGSWQGRTGTVRWLSLGSI